MFILKKQPEVTLILSTFLSIVTQPDNNIPNASYDFFLYVYLKQLLFMLINKRRIIFHINGVLFKIFIVNAT